jgi:hypothetical protein
MANSYVKEAEFIEPLLTNGFSSKEVELFNQHGIFYGVHISPKMLALCEGLYVNHEELLLPGFPEPYSLPKEPPETIKRFFEELKKQRGLDLDLSSIILSDTTTPQGYEGKRILNPTNLNQKLTELSKLTTEMVKTEGKNCDPLYFICTDSDSPHRILITEQKKPIEGYPLTPGLTMCGSTAKIEGFSFNYMYRIGIIAQTLSNNIIGSRMKGKFSPFMFVGMLSPFGYVNGAVQTGKMGELRYEGNIDLRKEFDHLYEKQIRKLI